MNSVLKEIQHHAELLPLAQQAELLDYTMYLEQKVAAKGQQCDHLTEALEKTAAVNMTKGEWDRTEFSQFSMNQAMRGMEEEPPLYTLDDLKERWR